MQLISRGTTHKLEGTLEIPVSKYHAHRALVLASLAEGTSVITGVSTTRQVEWTVSVLRALGTKIEITDAGYTVTGTGGRFHGAPVIERGSRGEDGLLNVGSSGTTLYFITGLMSLSDRPTTVTGMKYFRRRPIKALLSALIEMGLELESTNDCPPITVQPKRPKGGDVHIAGTLSQWVSGLLLTAIFAESDTTIHITGGQLNEQPYVDLTIRMMKHWGFEVEVSEDWLTYVVRAGQTGTAADYTIPADIGSAAFGIAAAALHPSDVLFRGLPAATTAEVDHPEAEFLDIAASMGVPMVIDEATGWVRITHDGLALKPFDIDATPIPDLLPILSVMANFAEGTSHLRNVGHVRLKESDRVAAMLQLNKMGGDATQEPTELHINGVGGVRGTGAKLSSFNDHRVLMSLAIAGTRSDGETSLTYPRAYRISYPTFLEAMTSIGLDIDVDAPSKGDEDDETQVQASAPVSAEPLVLPIAVREYARTKADEAAVIEVGGGAPITTTWGQLQTEADKVSQLLLELGVEKGESVGVQLPNWSEFVAIALGAMQIGAVVTPIMPVFGPREVAMTLSRSRARVLFLPNLFRKRHAAIELVSVADEARSQGRKLHLEHVIVLQAENRDGGEAVSVPPIPEEAIARAEASSWTWRYYENALGSVEPDLAQIANRMPAADDVCQLLFTSGTTGEPKGVQHPYRTLGLATALHVQRSGLTGDDRVFIPSPLAHQTGFLYGMLLAWRLGVASVIQPVWDGQVALDQAFGEAKASFVQAATPFLTDLVALVEGGAAKPEALRIFVATGAAVPRELAGRATTVLDTAVLGAFGTTETCLATLSGPGDQPESMWGTDGRVLDGITLRITDDEGVEVPTGTEGNFEFASPTLFGGYLERPDLTADVFTDDGWYKTGDLAYVDEAGYLHITGRVKDVINRGGEKIPVVEIENLLYQHPLVADVAIVAMPDPRLGERACAFVVNAKAGAKLEFAAMQEYLNTHGVSKYYWPERLEYVDELPRNAVGKIQKNVLRDTAAALVAVGK
ncbi:3-phosphoshikimate 1-carboxyvinyltransferase [Gryllotalpicola protaetiae]|uniref:3-phosphoshikimate 1-carboxyvinyltransferase n=1 Tax=Gryllotalpicola protaetiae TaxID=2419771 RepID=A0A387BIU7_9MICO|nr:3-phosphoshikimate 1-carboxyvinyltransferase [Gryllotalpicola protaetiae]AYG02142.1 3-phosphoshikimate 1-carboxyvinyltransferase [Gryllotalpicola protaetiae]